MKTSYYQSKKLDPTKHLVVQASNGEPRFGTQPEWESEYIMPPPALVARAKAGLGEFAFYREYAKHLDSIGVEKIRDEMSQLLGEVLLESGGDATRQREVILCCFCGPKQPYCHRRMFATWWEKQTGQKIEEL
jgi:hypothetical protein